jgi:hypothetical protein
MTKAPATIRQTLDQLERDYAWLSRRTGINYKTLLAQVKHEKSPLSLENAILIAKALGTTVPKIVAGS